MPPKQPGSVDGINRAPADAVEPPADQLVPKQAVENKPPTAAIQAALKPSENNVNPAVKNEVKTSKQSHTSTITILITLIIMVLLIGLAYFAYNKSKTG